MQSPFPFDSMLVFGFLSALLLFGAIVRARFSVIQRFLFPSCLLGGILGLILMNSGWISIRTAQLETFAYHLFNISFISMGLTGSSEKEKRAIGKKGHLKGAIWMALVQGVTFPLQAIIGGGCVLVAGFLGYKLFDTFGFLSPLGFNEGPGQALSFGKVWESVGFNDATTIGLTFAAVGFFFAFFIGIPLANWGIRKGLATNAPKTLSKDFLMGIIPKTGKKETAGHLTLHSGNLDSLAFQASMIGLVYLLCFGFVNALGLFLEPDVSKMIWGLFFFFGLIISIMVRTLMGMARIDYLIDSGIQNRVTGWSVDFLIVSTVAAIQITVAWKYVIPIATICLINGLLTTLVVLFLGRRLWSQNLERLVAIFGTVTGTVSCGLLLLRIVDPDFKTSVSIEIAIMNLFVLPFIFVCLLLVNSTIWWNWSLWLTILAFGGILILSLTLLKLFHFWGDPKF